MLCVMQNHIIQAFANSGNAIKPVSFIRDLRSKSGFFPGRAALPGGAGGRDGGEPGGLVHREEQTKAGPGAGWTRGSPWSR